MNNTKITAPKEDLKAFIPVIHATRDYTAFKILRGNRMVVSSHMDDLITSIAQKNLLPYNPAITNEKYEIIDGQTRFESCMEGKMVFYYVVCPEAGLEEVKLLNNNLWKWTQQDYLDSFIKQGIKEYIQLKEFCKEYNLSLSLGTLILEGKFERPYAINKKFRNGLFEIVNYTESENVASLLNEVKKSCEDTCWRDREFLIALMQMRDKIDPNELLKSLEHYELKLSRQGNIKNYLRQFEDVVNFKKGVHRIRLY